MDKNWLSDEFLTAVFGEGVKRSEVSIEIAGPAADNFLSDIHRLTYGHQSYIVKLKPVGNIKSIVDDLAAFEKELSMYDFLDDIERVTGQTFGPKRVSYKDLIILEDLKAKGFQVEDRRTQLGLNHCRAAMQCLARFHAASYMVLKDSLKKKQYQLLREDVYFGTSKDKLYLMTLPVLKQLISRIRNWPEVMHLADKLDKYIDSCFHLCGSEVLTGSNCGLLTHTNNIMFNDSLDVKLIDFQMSKENKPALDIILFMLASMKPDVKDNHLNSLLELYADNFNNFLSSFDVPYKITIEDIQRDLNNLNHFTFYTAALRAALILSESSEEIKENSLEPSSTHNLFDNKVYRKIICTLKKKRSVFLLPLHITLRELTLKKNK